jgi:ligand-binding sensor domain-containing protein
MPQSGQSGIPAKLFRWRSAWQFLLAISVIFAVSFTVDPIAEHFRRKKMAGGWSRFRPPHETSALLREGGRLWAGGRDGLSLIDWPRAQTMELPAGTPRLERVRSILLDRTGAIWVAHVQGVERLERGTWIRLNSAVGPSAAIVERRSGEIWVGGETGLARWNGAKFELVKESPSLGIEGVEALLEDRTGDLWIASAHPVRGGAGRLTAAGAWESYTRSDGLAHPSVSSFFEDREGGLWFASGFGRQGGACRLLRGTWTRLTKADGLASDRTRLVYEDRYGRLWVGSEVDGTAVRSGGSWRVLTPHDGMTGWEVKCIIETPDGAVWFGTEDGVMRLDGKAGALQEGKTL